MTDTPGPHDDARAGPGQEIRATGGHADPDAHEPPRRPMSVRHVMVVCVVALLVGSLLNAPGILKTAKGQPVGWRRDVAVALARPLADVSHALRTDRFRAGLQDVLGRAGDDDIDESLPSPTTTAPAGDPVPKAPPKPVFSPDDRLRFWAGGDSLGETPGTSVVNALAANPATEPSGGVDAHVATGLARPEVFNWPAHLVDVVNTQDPDALVLSLGSNDNQALTGEGSTGAAFGSDEWKAEYARRVGGLMDAVATDGRVIFWLGVPIVRQENKLESYRFINAIVEEQAALRPGRVVYVDTYDLLSGPDGAYADYLPNDGGELVEARAPDGTHYTRFGGDRIAASVVAAMNATFTLRPTAPTTTTRARPTDEPSTTKKEK